MSPVRRALLRMAPLALLAACTNLQLGRDFDLAAFEARVQRGATTQAQVREWIGAPAAAGVSVDTAGERFSEWTYYHGAGQLPDLGVARLKMLQIKFDQRGVVRAYNWSGERP